MEQANTNWDGDPMLNWQEYRSRTDPTDSDKFLRFTAIQSDSNATGVVVQWTSESNVVYRLEFSTDLLTDFFTNSVYTNIAATPPTNTAADGTERGGTATYYRVGVEQ